MTDPAKDAERLAEIQIEIGGRQWGTRTIWKEDAVFLLRLLEERDATIARLTQERDEAVQEATMRRNDWQAVTQERDEARRSSPNDGRSWNGKVADRRRRDQQDIQPSVDGLIARLEAATEGSVGLDKAIARLVDTYSAPDRGDPYGGTPFYTASIDAALTLVPDDCAWELRQDAAWVKWPAGDPRHAVHHEFYGMGGKCTAIALCACALEARQTAPQTVLGTNAQTSNTDPQHNTIVSPETEPGR